MHSVNQTFRRLRSFYFHVNLQTSSRNCILSVQLFKIILLKFEGISVVKWYISISVKENEMFVKEFNDSGYIKMKDLLTEYNMAHINTSEATDEIRGQYYLDKIDILKHVVSIPKISITYNIHEALTISDYKLNTPGI